MEHFAGTIRWTTVLTTVLMQLPQLLACSCAPTPPPCQAYWQSPLVFVGTVTDALATRDGRIVRAHMRIDRAYKGVSEPALTLFDNGMCDGPDLKVGEQYLMYTRRADGDDIPSRGCTRSSHVKFAAEDLKYLEGLSQAAPIAAVFGQVASWPVGPGGKVPLPGASVKLAGSDEPLTAVADATGHYSFNHLKPGKYSVSASHPGFIMPPDDYGLSADVAPRACAAIDVTLRKEWPGTIAGRLLRADGKPAAAGVDVSLIPVAGEGGNEFPLGQEVRTDAHGEYSFRSVRAGSYKVVVHRCCFPTPEAPYPSIYWPAAATEESASEIVIEDGAPPQHYDFFLPPEIRSAVVNGLVWRPDAKPAPGAKVWLFKLPAKDGPVETEACCAVIDQILAGPNGAFAFKIMAGIEYGLAVGEGPWSKIVPFSAGKLENPIVLILEAPGQL